MRIVCDNCGAKYQIGDDKVRNKVFKIRCKKCSHTIVVRAKEEGAGDAGEDATRVVSVPSGADSMESPAPDGIWYIVVQREQKGPFTPSDIEQMLERGDVDAESFTWAEGMADWIRLASVTEFSHLFPAAAPAPAARPSSEKTKPAAAESLFPSDEAEDDVMTSDRPAVGAAASNLFGDDDSAATSAAASSPRVSGNEQKLRSQRNENSVLFSLDSLAGEAEARKSVSNTGGSDGSGLIDISGLIGPSTTSSGTGDAFGLGPVGLAPAAPSPIASQPLPSLVARKKSNTGLYVAIIAGAAIVAGAVVFVMKGSDKPAEGTPAASTTPVAVAVGSTQAPVTQAPVTAPPTEVASSPAAATLPAEAIAQNTPPAEPNARRAAGGAAGAPRVAGSGGGARAATNAGGGAEDAPPPAVAQAPKPAAAAEPPPARPKKSGGEVDDLLGALDGSPAPKRGGGAAAAAPAASADPLLPESLTKPQIMTVVKKGLGSVNACKDRQPDASGTVVVKMKIEGNGSVSSAQAQSPFSGTPVGNCVESTVRGFRFPQFSGPAMPITMPFAL